MSDRRRPAPFVVVLVVVAGLALGGCAGAAAPPPSSAPRDPGSSQPSIAPNDPPPSARSGDPSSGAGGGSDGSTGSGIGISPPVGVDPIDPGAGQPTLVRPKPGQKDPRPVAPTRLETSIDGRHVLVKVTWASGVAPCSVLDSVRVERSGGDISITPMEGIGDPDAMCIEIAQIKATIVDLGELDPGSYRVLAPTGDALPVTFTIS